MKLTQEQLAELIAKVFTNLDEKRKAISEGGESSLKAWRVPSRLLASL